MGCLVLAAAAISLDRAFPPDLSRLAGTGTVIRDAQGEVLALRPAAGGVWRFDTRAEAVPPVFLKLLVETEDRRFWSHPGVDPLAAARAALQMARVGRVVSGGSTLTMQVARLLEPRPRGLRAKLIESARALQLSAHYSKREVLGMWLGLAPFGGNLVGVEAGSRAWFGKPAHALDTAEAASLVALPRRPEALRPDRFPERAKALRDRVLDAAGRTGALTAREAAGARSEPVPTHRTPMPSTARSLLAGYPGDVATTLDGPVQRALDTWAAGEASRLPEHVSVSVMVANVADRTVVAATTAGGPTPPDLTRAVRSPGSTLKPLLYALAFEEGLAAPDTVLMDAPRRFGAYAPENISRRFAGPVTATEALRRSLNLPAVGLLERYGPARFAAALEPAGLILPRDAEGSLPVILGGGGMQLRGLMGLYSALATDGRFVPLRLTHGEGPPDTPLLTASAAAMTAAILTRPFPGGGPDGVAWKTGTSAAGRDAWAIGFDRLHVIGIWVGRPDATPQPGVMAADLALPLLARAFALVPPAPRARPVAAHPATLATRPADDRVMLLYPPPDSTLTGTGPVTLRARGGTRPLTFLVDDVPLPSVPALREASWSPPGPGFYDVRVLDAEGGAAVASVRVLPNIP